MDNKTVSENAVAVQEETTETYSLNFSEFEAILSETIRDYLKSSPRFVRYTKDQIRQYLEHPEKHSKDLRQISLFLIGVSSVYARLVIYFATMLTLDYILIPINLDENKIKTDNFRREYNRILKYLEAMDVKRELSKVLMYLVLEDEFFGVERKLGDSYILQRFPPDYCRFSGWYEGGKLFEFDLSYFTLNEAMLKNYPAEIQRAYRKYKTSNKGRWYEVKENPVYFKLNEFVPYCLPLLSGVWEDIWDLEGLKALEIVKDKAENFKLVAQKIPMKKDARGPKDFIIDPQSVKIFHDKIVEQVPEGVAVVSTPMDLDLLSFEQRTGQADKVQQKLDITYSSAGVSRIIFNGSLQGNIGLSRSIQTNENMMFTVLRQFEQYFKYRLAQITASAYRFKLWFPEITRFNRKEMFEVVLKSAQFGFPKSLLAACLGYTPNDLIQLTLLENDYLGLVDRLLPLKSSHTTSTTAERGRPQKSEEELSDEGLKTRDTEANENRSQ